MESNALGTWLLLLSLHTICQCWNSLANQRFVIRFRRVFQEALKVQIAFCVSIPKISLAKIYFVWDISCNFGFIP